MLEKGDKSIKVVGNNKSANHEEDGDCIWTGTNGGLVKIDKTSGETTFYNRANSGLPDNEVYSIAINGRREQVIGYYIAVELRIVVGQYRLRDSSVLY